MPIMSQPYTDTDALSSNLAAHPSFSNSSTPSFSSAPHSIFNQKLIPRDFLGSRSKSSSDTVSKTENATPNTLFTINPFKSEQTIRSKKKRNIQDDLAKSSVSPTTKSAFENGVLDDHGLSILRTTSPEPLHSLISTTKTRSASSVAFVPLDAQAFARINMPRTSSIDSAISNVSTTSLSKATGDTREPSPTSVRNLIATAAGAENLITHLLRDKNSIASQNAQLWKLVEKQRSLIFGLNKDLERVTKERDKYKKRAKDLQVHTISEHGELQQQIHAAPRNDDNPIAHSAFVDQRIQPSNILSPSDNNKKLLPASILSDNATATHPQKLQAGHDKEYHSNLDTTRPILPEVYVDQPESRNVPAIKTKLEIPIMPPALQIIDASPLVEKPIKNLPSTRKAPPKPLNLAQGKSDGLNSNGSITKTEHINTDEEPERGRRRTREEDDRDREASAKKAEAEARSRSKKNKVPGLITTEENQMPVQTQVTAPLPTQGLPLSPRPQHAQAFIAPTGHLVAPNTTQHPSLNERLLITPLKSPGLPLSPRPINRNESMPIALSLPLSPRANMAVFPLSPRAPKHALPAPTNLAAPTDAAALQNKQSRGYQSSPQTASPIGDRLQVHQPVGTEAPPVYRGLAVSTYPNLLLPPNALPSIQVQVHSSRLQPSRHSVTGLKNQEETTVFSLSVISRSSNSELWRIEKVPAALPQLEQQLKPRCVDLPKMPERRLFVGQSPALLDERRVAIDKYFDELLDTHVDEQAAIAICRFLSTDVIDPEHQLKTTPNGGIDLSFDTPSPTKPITKTGYLTKRGKNFGGWKSRFFILEGTEFRYYESAGGPHLGTIRLKNALIGKQKDSETTAEDGEGQYRHAILVQEPKRKESGNYVRHVLCADSDLERDEWVKALLYWVEAGTNSKSASRNNSASAGVDLNDLDNRSQSSRAGPSSKELRDTPTPTSGSSIDSSMLDQVGPTKAASISNPMNGGVITDNSSWGYKSSNAFTPKEFKDKTHKMSNIFGFKRPEPQASQQDQKPAKPRILRHNGYVRPVFGLPLAEAVEFCAPFNVEVDLPAVVYRSIEYLRHKNAASEEGLFRLSGSNVVVRSLKERFNTEGDVDLVREDEYHDVHAVASLFKTYLRELPSTLLTRDLHIEFIKVLEMDSNEDKIKAYNTLVHMLPAPNFSLLRELSKYLLEVTRSADKNKMSVRNIGIVFSPTLNIPTPVFTLFLNEFEAIFENESNEPSEIRTTEINVPSQLTPDDIRSPRHQMFSDLPTPAYHQTTFQIPHGLIPPRGTMTGTGEMGFMPINPIYESGNHVALPRNAPPQPAKTVTQVQDIGGYSSLNSLLAPTTASTAPTDKARKRESMMLFAAN